MSWGVFPFFSWKNLYIELALFFHLAEFTLEAIWTWYYLGQWILKWKLTHCFKWTVVLEKTLESPLDCKEIQPVHSEGDQLWVFFGKNDAKAESPVLWPPHAKMWLIGKDTDAGRDWGQEEKGMTEDEMSGLHHRLNGQSLSELRELLMDREAWRAAIPGVTKSRTQLRYLTKLNWTELKYDLEIFSFVFSSNNFCSRFSWSSSSLLHVIFCWCTS